MDIQGVSTIITAITPLIVGIASGIWAIMRVRGSKADRLLRIMRDEVELMTKLPDDSVAIEQLKVNIDATAKQYAQLRKQQSRLQRDTFAVALAAILALFGIGLAIYASYQGGLMLLLDIVAAPLMIFGIPGFFYELSGGSSREKETDADKPAIEDSSAKSSPIESSSGQPATQAENLGLKKKSGV